MGKRENQVFDGGLLVHHGLSQQHQSRPSFTTALLLTGQAGGGGTACGPARVMRGPATAVPAGSILVIEAITPTWIPLLPGVAGLVAATGGILSNGAIVARELGIPLVVGATGCTTSIQDGHWLVVGGTNGLVQLLRPAHE